MNISYQGLGQRCATFAGEDMRDGALVKVSANGTVAACAAGDAPVGVVVAASRDGEACTVQLGGFVTVKYSGAPTLGYCAVVADGAGGVKNAETAAEGRTVLVVEKDTAAGTLTMML